MTKVVKTLTVKVPKVIHAKVSGKAAKKLSVKTKPVRKVVKQVKKAVKAKAEKIAKVVKPKVQKVVKAVKAKTQKVANAVAKRKAEFVAKVKNATKSLPGAKAIASGQRGSLRVPEAKIAPKGKNVPKELSMKRDPFKERSAKAKAELKQRGKKIADAAKKSWETRRKALQKVRNRQPAKAKLGKDGMPKLISKRDMAALELTKATTGKGAVKAQRKFTTSRNRKRNTPKRSKGDHYSKHAGEFKLKNGKFKYNSTEAYAEGAQKFFNKPPEGTLSGKRTGEGWRGKKDDIIRFNESTDEFVVVTKTGSIRSYFKPNPKIHGFETNKEYFYSEIGYK